MVIVDTSVWISHFRKGDANLEGLLRKGNVDCHPFVIGELACGNLGNREEILRLLQALPQAPSARHEEVLRLIESRNLTERGLGYVDIHLLASALIGGVVLWTFDLTLKATAEKLGVGYHQA